MYPVNNEVKFYYNKIAAEYDKSRFSNSYGAFIHQQETQIFNKEISLAAAPILDAGCGTGRFLNWATTGLDISEKEFDLHTIVFHRHYTPTHIEVDTLCNGEKITTSSYLLNPL